MEYFVYPELVSESRPKMGGWAWALGLSFVELCSLGLQPWWWRLHWAMWREFRDLSITETVRLHGGESPGSLAYGETPTLTLHKILELSGVPLGSRFVDLGSGRGVTVLGACLLGYEARGLELVGGYVERARRAAERLDISAEFVLGDLLKHQWPEAELYLLNSTAFSPEFREALLERLTKVGDALLVTYDWSLPSEEFVELRAHRFPVTWGTVMCRFYRVRERPSPN